MTIEELETELRRLEDAARDARYEFIMEGGRIEKERKALDAKYEEYLVAYAKARRAVAKARRALDKARREVEEK